MLEWQYCLTEALVEMSVISWCLDVNAAGVFEMFFKKISIPFVIFFHIITFLKMYSV